MAKCKYCKTKVSYQARTCPKCGCPNPVPKLRIPKPEPKLEPDLPPPDLLAMLEVAYFFTIISSLISLYFFEGWSFIYSFLGAFVWPFIWYFAGVTFYFTLIIGAFLGAIVAFEDMFGESK